MILRISKVTLDSFIRFNSSPRCKSGFRKRQQSACKIISATIVVVTDRSSRDVGTVYIYMMRYFFAYEPRKLLCSNGQQTLGVGMPWAIASSLVQDPPCSQKVVSVSGDGGFMFSSQELSTAVLQGCNITHFIWNDEAYNMVRYIIATP